MYVWFPRPRSRLKIWSREMGSVVASRVSLLISILRLNLVLIYGIPPDFRGRGVCYIINRLLIVLCVVNPFILDVRLVDVPAGVTHEEGHTGFLIHLPSAVLALIFFARRIQPLFFSLVESIVLHLLGIFYIFYIFVFCEEKSGAFLGNDFLSR